MSAPDSRYVIGECVACGEDVWSDEEFQIDGDGDIRDEQCLQRRRFTEVADDDA